jgi:hypothetical protein
VLYDLLLFRRNMTHQYRAEILAYRLCPKRLRIGASILTPTIVRFQPLCFFTEYSWGVAPGWDRARRWRCLTVTLDLSPPSAPSVRSMRPRSGTSYQNCHMSDVHVI